MQTDKFEGAHGKQLEMYVWETESPKAVVLIVHGMAEHMARYDDFAKYLNSKGIIAAGLDLRGHGQTDNNTLGYCEGEMWKDSIIDQVMFAQKLKEKYGVKLVVLGHSYGSFITQALIEESTAADMYILSGSCYMKSIEVLLGNIIAKSIEKHKGGQAKAEQIFNMTFGAYDKKFNGKAAWLSRDKAQVEKYNNDEMCGYCCSAHFYVSFFNGLTELYKKENLQKVDINIPIYIYSGSVDPVGKAGSGVKKLYDMYKKLGVRNLNMKLYENELNNVEVYIDVVETILQTLKCDI
ncbi:MAG: alpha/beta fold hydrolase [Clostridia bacterium]